MNRREANTPCRGGFPGFPFVLYSAKEGDCMAFDKGKYDVEYARANITRVHIPFNKTNKEDMEILEHLKAKGNRTAYIKNLVYMDMIHERMTAHEEKMREIEQENRTALVSGDPICELCTDENLADCKKHDNRIHVELVDDFEDKEAIEKATKEEHRIYHDVIGYHDVIIDRDERKVLKVKNRCPLSID